MYKRQILLPVEEIDSVKFVVSDTVLAPVQLPLEYVLEYNVDPVSYTHLSARRP